jgi:hypothetical protein
MEFMGPIEFIRQIKKFLQQAWKESELTPEEDAAVEAFVKKLLKPFRNQD